MRPAHRVRMAKVMLVACLIGWPTSALTIASSEPPVVLGLSWVAIILTALDLLATSDVRQQHDQDDD